MRTCNTLVWGILVCAYSHTFYSPFLDYYRPKTNVKSQRYRVFVFMTVQVRILQKQHEKQPKSLKRARDVKESLKTESTMISTHEKPKITKLFLKSSKR